MDNDLEQQILKRIQELPESVRSAIQSSNLHATLQSIGQRHKLHIDQLGELEDETYLVMLGFSTPESFEGRLMSALHIEQGVAAAIATDVNEQIFLSIREAMKAPSVPKSPAPTPPATPTQTKAAEVHPAETMLTQKTVSVAPAIQQSTTPAAKPGTVAPPETPKTYTTDPYREAI